MKTNTLTSVSDFKKNGDETTAKKLGYFIFSFGMLVLTLSFLSSCNTTRGFGRDVQKVGNRIEHRAAQVQSGN
jgi:predicted small secreted protein